MAERRRPVAIAVIAVWMVFWGAGMIIAVTILGGAVLAGEVVPAVFLAVWLGVAALGLFTAGRRLGELLTGEPRRGRPPSLPHGRHDWRDDMPGGPRS